MYKINEILSFTAVPLLPEDIQAFKTEENKGTELLESYSTKCADLGVIY